MEVQINSDNNVVVSAGLSEHIETGLGSALSQFGDRLTRVEVHLRDDSAGRQTEDDIRCLIEARPAGQQPVAVTDRAEAAATAFDGAIDKLVVLLEAKFGRIQDKDFRDTIRGS